MTEEEYVRRLEFQQYCKSVNGDLAGLKIAVTNMETKMDKRFGELLEHFDAIVSTETDRRRLDTKEAAVTARADTASALVMAKDDVKEALSGTINRTYAIIITVLTGACVGLLSAVITLVATRH
jgi:hypothetical protein